jgi:hypothetical protein
LLTGYLHPSYAASLAEFGRPRQLGHSGAWILERPIPGSTLSDAMGCYPLLACPQWQNLPADLDELSGQLVSLTFVADPFGDADSAELRASLDVCAPFKLHYVADLSLPREETVSKSHRKHARRALRKVSVEECPHPPNHLDEWIELYDHLIQRHQIGGLRAFSPDAFARQLAVPGAVLFRVRHGGETIGANLFYLQNDVAYSHLSAFSERGYSLGASYAVKWYAMERLAGSVRWLDFGGAAGLSDSPDDGLAQFKRGWTTGERLAYLCGAVLAPEAYDYLTRSRGIQAGSYFPAYRNGEFA